MDGGGVGNDGHGERRLQILVNPSDKIAVSKGTDKISEVLNLIESKYMGEVDIEKLVYSLKDDMDNELEKSIKQVDLEGDEILNLLNNNFPEKISKIFDEIMKGQPNGFLH